MKVKPFMVLPLLPYSRSMRVEVQIYLRSRSITLYIYLYVYVVLDRPACVSVGTGNVDGVTRESRCQGVGRLAMLHDHVLDDRG